jgi:uncharacterized membrane protein
VVLKRKEVTKGKFKGHIYLHDAENGSMHHNHIPHHMLPAHMLKFYPKDVLQVIIGATILAIPLSYTEETWALGSVLPFKNILMIGLLSFLFISTFIFYNYYKHRFKENKIEFFVRCATTYLVSLLVVSLILTLIAQANWISEPIIALRRTIIIGFPASMSAAIADILK